MLHLDKNTFVGVEGAFKIIGEVWGVHYEKDTIFSYDMKGNMPSFQLYQKIQKPPNAILNANNGHYKHHPPTQPNMDTNSSFPVVTFWLSYPFCKMQYEYSRLYVNHPLLYKTCQKCFVAFEIKQFSRTEVNATVQNPIRVAVMFSHML